MKLRRKTLWRLPVFCLVASVACRFITILGLDWLFTSHLADGSFVTDGSGTGILYGVEFVLTLLLGGLLVCRRMTRREVAASAAILIGYGLLVCALEALLIDPLSSQAPWRLFAYARIPFAYADVIRYLLPAPMPLWTYQALSCLAPVLFLPFGKQDA